MKAFHEVRNYNSDFMVWQCDYENISFLAHWHPELELIYIRSGDARFSINDDEFVAHAGDLVFVDTGDFHYSDSYEYCNVLDFIIFDPSVIDPLYRHAHFAHPLITSELLEAYGLQELMQRLFADVSLELKEQQPYYQEVVSGMLREFVYRLRRCHPRSVKTSTSHSHRTEMLYDMQQLLTYIDEHYGENITLSFAAERMNFSESHFSKVFKKLIGINFVTYINAVRVEHAASMLKNSSTRITDIAMQCGFGNVRSFNRTFKEFTGYTPSQFLRLSDIEVQHFSYYKRKSDQKEFVQDDSLTVVPNARFKESLQSSV